MKQHTRRAAWIAAATLTAAMVLTPTALAGVGAGAEYSDAIGIAWDPAGPYETSTTVTIFPNPRVVPGDTDQQSLYVRNDGPTAGTLSATMTNVQLAGDVTDEFYTDFLINGTPVADLYGADHTLLVTDLDRDAIVNLDFDYEFPEAATSGNYPVEGTVAVSFDVELSIGGELPPPPKPDPDPDPKPVPPTPTPPAPKPPTIPVTGFGSFMWVAALAAGLAGVGAGVYRRQSRAARRGH